jgi:SAM-dependent methyltransferase
MEFQKNYSRHFPAVKDESIRKRKSQKILRAFQDHWQRDRLEGLVGLDLGCSLGMISRALSEAGARMYGIDIDREALSLIPASWREGSGFMVGDACSTPFKPGSFDLIICSQVYEHSPSLTRLAGEIFRLLKKGGVCFFSGPNKWAVMEGHYHRPFLSWIPRKWADSWVRSKGLGDGYYEKPVSAKKLRKALQAFIIRDLTPDLMKYPERYALGEEVGRWRYLSRKVPAPGWFLLGRVVPNFNWLLIKPTR